ncbi:MAG TPA: restriction endonuclease, partial [bacterium]|nr:restriction endonuclease [bacterium]
EARAVLEFLARQVLTEQPSTIEVRRLLARTCAQLHDYPAALREYDTLIAVAPAKVDYVFERGLLRRELKQWAPALDDFALVVRERANFDEGLWRQAEALLALQRPAEAKPVLRRLVELRRNHAQGLSALGGLLLAEGDAKGAVELLQAAVKEAGDRAAEPYALLARAWRQLNEPLRGVRLLEEAVLKFSDRQEQAAIKHELAFGYDRMGERAKARTCMREVYAVRPDLPGVREFLVDDLSALNDDDVLAYFNTLHLGEYAQAATEIVEMLGFRVVRAQPHSFEALDVSAERVRDTYTEKAVFNFRRWTHTIAELPLRELHRQVLEERAHRGFFVAPTQYTSGAIRESLALRVELIDRVRLVRLLREQHMRGTPPGQG